MDVANLYVVRNVLFIMAGRLRWDSLSGHGDHGGKTPNMDWLARHGVRFENAYAQAPAHYAASRSASGFGDGGHAMLDPIPFAGHKHRLDRHLRTLDICTATLSSTACSGATGVTDRALDFIWGQGEQPWCLHLSYAGPRSAPAARSMATPSAPPQDWLGRLDEELGRLFDLLADMGRMQDTLVIFCGGQDDSQAAAPALEQVLDGDASVKVPLVVCDPRQCADARRGATERRPVQVADVVPTILEAYELEDIRLHGAGRSLRPLLHKAATAWHDMAWPERGDVLENMSRQATELPGAVVAGIHAGAGML